MIYIFNYINSGLKSQFIKNSRLEYNFINFIYNYRKVQKLAIKSIQYEKSGENKRLKKNITKLKFIIKKTDSAADRLKIFLSKNTLLINKPTVLHLNKYINRYFDIYRPVLSQFIAHPVQISENYDSISPILTKNIFIINVLGPIIKNLNKKIDSVSRTFNFIFILGIFIIFTFIILFFYYISERDIKLSEQKQLFDALLGNTNDYIAIKDIHGRFIEASKSLRDLYSIPYEFSIANITGREIKSYSSQSEDFFHTDEDMDKLVWQTRKPQKFLLKLKDKDRSIHTVDLTKIPIIDTKGNNLFSITIGHDITAIIEDEEKFKSMFYDNFIIMFILDIETMTILYINDSALKFYGFLKEELIGKTLNETFNPFITKEEVSSNIKKAAENSQKIFSGYKHRLKSGEVRDVEVGLSPFYIKGKLVELVTVFDVTDKLANEAKIKSLQSLYYSILKEVSLIMNPKSEGDIFHRTLIALWKSKVITACWIGCIEDDRSIKYMAAKGKGVQELMKIKLTADCDKQYMTLAERAICFNRIVYNNDHLSDPSLEPWQDFLKKNCWLSACACPIYRDNKIYGVLVCISDKKDMFDQNILEFISKIGALLSHSLNELDLKNKLEEEKRKVEYLAHHDALTGLPNRLFLTQLMDSVLKRADRNKTYTAIGMIDFDDFKYINDAFGHNEGDSLLKQFAHRIKSVLRQTDHMVRLGGDEFVLILEDLKTPNDIYIFVLRLEDAIKKPFRIKNSEIFLRISLGLTLYPLDKESSEVLLMHADNAMYNIKMKKEGREKFWHLYEYDK